MLPGDLHRRRAATPTSAAATARMCAGIIGGTGAASAGGRIEGVAPGARHHRLRLGRGAVHPRHLGGFDYALTHQAQYNIRVVSNSFGNTGDSGTAFDPDDPTNIATKKLADRGVVVVFSAGNSGSGEGTITGNFKKAPWVVTVAAGDKQGRLADFSSRGEDGQRRQGRGRRRRPTRGGPPDGHRAGRGHRTRRAPRRRTCSPTCAEQDVAEIGPSAAPCLHRTCQRHLDGRAARGRHRRADAGGQSAMGWREVKQILQDTATNMPGSEAWEAGAGYVNAYAAVQAALGAAGFGSDRQRQPHASMPTRSSPCGSSTDYAIDFSPVGPTGGGAVRGRQRHRRWSPRAPTSATTPWRSC